MCHPIDESIPRDRRSCDRRPRGARPAPAGFRFAPAAARSVALAAALAAALLIPALPAFAQEEPAPQGAPEAAAPVEAVAPIGAAAAPAPIVESPAASGDLADRIAARFEVLPTRDGLLLRPRAAGAGYHAIEIEEGAVAVDGETLPEGELAGRLGADAEPVSRLAALGPASRALFGYGVRPPVEEPATPAAGEATAAGEASAVPPPPGVELPELPEPPEAPEPPELPQLDVGQRVSITSSVTVEEGEVAETAVAVGGDVRVDGEVERDVVAVGGAVRVNGRVGGEVVAVGGSVYAGPDAVIEGNVTSVGGQVEREPGAQIGGQVSEVSMTGAFFDSGRFRGERDDWHREIDGRMERIGDVFGHAVGLVVLVLLIALVTVLGRAPVERVAAKAAHDPWRALIAGFLTELLFFPVLAVIVLILVISVVGIPLLVLVPFVLLLFVVAFLVGIAGVARTVSGLVERRFGWRLEGVFLPALVGVTAIHVWALFGSGLDAIGGPMSVAAVMFWLFGWTVQFLAWTIGLGAVILTRFGAGPRPVPGALPSPALPPGGPGTMGTAAVPPAAPAAVAYPAVPPPVRADSLFEPEPVPSEPAAAPEPKPPPPAPAAEPEPAPAAEPAYEPDDDRPRG